MARLIDLTLQMRMTNIRKEIPKYWRDLAKDINPGIDLEGMRNVYRGRSHEEEFVKTFEQIVIQSRTLQSLEK